jgi:hypothetical protein
MPEPTRQKITFAEMRAAGVRGLLIYCADYRCSHHITISGDRWADDVRLSDLEPRFVCQLCGRRGADVRPNFDWEREARLTRDVSGIDLDNFNPRHARSPHHISRSASAREGHD